MITAALLISALLQFADAATTIWILRHGGVELNPFMRWLIARVGVRIAMGLKVTGALILLGWCYVTEFFAPSPWAAYLVALVSMAGVVHNVVIFIWMRRR